MLVLLWGDAGPFPPAGVQAGAFAARTSA
jgi:hypothetical protein